MRAVSGRQEAFEAFLKIESILINSTKALPILMTAVFRKWVSFDNLLLTIERHDLVEAFDDIFDHCRFAGNRLIGMLWKIHQLAQEIISLIMI